ncbi:YeiH family protein [Aquibacillus sediminis]|uniref:YeiH family protein n=1 Tax=Aquibacillus sediminis TaxID=2574734 RepID=UPI001486513F|nr:YeiH family protein [Aquibacillus sediminis]
MSQQENNNWLKRISQKVTSDFVKGLLLTLVLAILAGSMAKLPILSIMGVMILSIFLGIGWKQLLGIPVSSTSGINFSSKILLRIGIILMGVRLNLHQIIEMGSTVILIDIIVVTFTLIVMIVLGKLFHLDEKFSALLAVGTAVCGAAAIVAVAPLIKAKKEHVAIAVAFIAILGTIGTIFYTILYAGLDFDSEVYGLLVGSTLHELAHVVAAALPGGPVSSDIAILVKMGRVALLIPVAIILGTIFSRKNQSNETGKKFSDFPVPWFIFGFLAMSIINSTGILPTMLIDFLIDTSILFLSMAMAGLGLSIHFRDFKKVGVKAVVVGVVGSILLAMVGYMLAIL